MIYQLSYELRTQEKDYSSFYSYLENLGQGALHILRDTWWIYFTEEISVDTLCDSIHEHMGENDIFVLTPLGIVANGWLATNAWNWRNRKLNNQ